MAKTRSGALACGAAGLGLGAAVSALAVPVAVAGLGAAAVVAGTATAWWKYPGLQLWWDYRDHFWDVVVPLHQAIWKAAGWSQNTPPLTYIDAPLELLDAEGGVMISANSATKPLLTKTEKDWIAEAARLKLRLPRDARYLWVEGGPHNYLVITARPASERPELVAWLENGGGLRRLVDTDRRRLEERVREAVAEGWERRPELPAAGEPLALPPGDVERDVEVEELPLLPSPGEEADSPPDPAGRPGSGTVVVAPAPRLRAVQAAAEARPGLITLRDASRDKGEAIVPLSLNQLRNDRTRYRGKGWPEPQVTGEGGPDGDLYLRQDLVRWAAERPVGRRRRQAATG